jgi:zinc transporter ZupT
MVGNSFTHKFLMTVFAGFAAACMLYLFRHIVQQAFYESGEGWKSSMKARVTPPPTFR